MEIDDFTLIQVNKPSGWKKVEVVNNPTSYELIGRGMQGAVFKLPNQKCVKIYPDEKHCRWEEEVLSKVQKSPFFPKLYDSGANYIIIEYVEGITLKDYLKNMETIPLEITQQIITIFKEMEHLKFTDYDIYLRHFMVTNNKTLKVIDHVKSFTRNRPQPKYFFEDLSNLGLLESFLSQAQTIDHSLNDKWKETIEKYL
ncbi:serine/threonine protein kinase [Neobacillus sp. NRS-1170]|uniref:serine/threonine protein kinase n=1 Tax=Neobacillus sp. NRS-1170 TaxID=3233898 RepID=UPI003D2D52EA